MQIQTAGLPDFDLLAKSAEEATFHLRLYISGITPRSTAAIANLKAICDEHISNRYKLEIVDIYQEPKLAKADQIVAVPALIKLKPLPPSRLVGEMSNSAKVLKGLGLGRS